MRTFLIMGLAFATSQVSAQEGQGKAHFGGGIGVINYEDLFDFDDSAPAMKLYGGYRFNESWSIEASYITTATLRDSTPPPFDFNITTDLEVIEVRGLYHRGPFFVGAGYWKADVSSNIGFGFPGSDSESGPLVMIGGEWAKKNWTYRIEYEFLNSTRSYSQASASMLNLGAHFRFK